MNSPLHQDETRRFARAQLRGEMLDWLLAGTRGERFLDDIFVAFCRRLREAGIPVARGTIHLRTHHPLWLGTRILWRTGLEAAALQNFEYGIVETDQFKLSPAAEIFNGAERVRKRST